MQSDFRDKLKRLPQVQKLLESDIAHALVESFSRNRVVHGVRAHLEELRTEILAGYPHDEGFSVERFFRRVRVRLEKGEVRNLRRVVNATGIVLHTNLGRTPLAPQALDAVNEAARGYSNLEYDVSQGVRGSRYAHVENLLCTLTGAEAALVVNNNAAAVILSLAALGENGEVIVSRGELVEIGGSFRIPDVIARSGARMIEVGATNKTRLADYDEAITENTRVLLKVHPSNFKIVGFTEAVSRADLVHLASKHKILVVEDLGSGTLVDLTQYGLPEEPTPQDVLNNGVDIVTFSGDKLLGGPQAGILVGKAACIERMKKNPLLRALRIDKLSLAALEATLCLYEDEETLAETLPILHLLTQDEAQLTAKAERLLDALEKMNGLTVTVVDGHGYAGGGSLPDAQIPTKLVTVCHVEQSEDSLAVTLRTLDTPIIGRISDDAFVMDMRTLFDEDLLTIIAAFKQVCA